MKYSALSALFPLMVLLAGGTLAAQTYPMNQQDPLASGFTASAPFGTIDLNLGWRFKANTNDIVVTKLGCNFPAGAPGVTVTLFDVASQSVLAQEVCGPGTGWQFKNLSNPVALTNGNEYVIAGLILGTIGPYVNSAPPASWIPTGDIQLLDNQYVASSSPSVFPATSIGAAQYGVVDFGYANGLVITSPTQLPDAGELTSYNQPLSATNGTPPYTWTHVSGNLPSGLSLAQSGNDFVLSGTPATGTTGTYNFNVKVTDSASGMETKSISLDVNGLTITSTEAPDGIAGSGYSEDIKAVNGQTPYSWTLVSGNLPSGLSIAQSGNDFHISGTPDLGSNGLYSFNVKVTDNLGANVAQTISLFIQWPTGTDIYPMAQQDPTASGFNAFNTYGSYSKWGYKFRVNATGVSVLRLGANYMDSSPVIVAIFDWTTHNLVTSATVAAGSGWRFANLATPVDLVAGKEYVVCGYQNSPASAYWHTNLPTSWKPTGDIEWLQSANDFYSTVPGLTDFPTQTVTNRMGGVVDIGYAKVLNISTDAILANATEQVAYSTNIQAASGTAPYSWSLVSGALPSGLNLAQVGNEFQLSGTPATGTPGSYTFIVKVTDNVGYTRTKAMQLVVAWPASHYTYPMTQQNPNTTGFNSYSGTSSSVYQWGWKFRVNTPGLTVLRLGSNFPNQSTTPHVVTLFDATTKAVLAQATCGTGTGWQFTELLTPVALNQGSEYVVAGLTGANYYYDTSIAASWKPVGDIEYLNGQGTSSGPPTPNTYPTSTYSSNTLYGVVDFGYSKSLSVVTEATLPSAAEQSAYSTDIEADFGATPYTWSLVSGTLPSGMNLAQSGDVFQLSGTPAAGSMGPYTFSVKVQDSLNYTHTKAMTLNVLQQSSAMPFTDDFSSDKGWQYGTDWSRGSATAFSGATPPRTEPGADHSASADNNIAGHRIGADYAANMLTTDWLTSPPFNCSGASIVSLRYYRWLGSTLGDTSKVQVTNNGLDWHDVWTSPTSSNLNDTAWVLVAHDISQWAAGNSVVQVRFGTGPTHSIVNTGWCIDDVLIFEPPPELEVREGGLTGTIITDDQAVGGLRDFGQVSPSTNSQILTIALTNNGLNTIHFSNWSKTGANPIDFYVLQNPPATLAPNTSATFQIQFYSPVVGVKTCTLSIPHDAVGSGSAPFEINLRAEAIVMVPGLQVDEGVSGGINIPHQAPAVGTSRDFGSVTVGGISSLFTIAITNTGNGPLTIQAIDMGGTWWNQFAVNTGPIPPSIAPGANMTFTVAFQPTSAGAKDAFVRIYHNDALQPSAYEVPVRGDAIPAAPVIGVSDGGAIAHNDPATGARNFGNVVVGSTSAPATIAVSNTGGATLTVGAITLGGPDAGEFTLNTATFNSSILVGATSSFEVRFAPTSVGVKVAQVTFSHNDSSVTSPFIINITGNGVLAAPVIDVRETNAGGSPLANPAPAAGILDFGNQPVSAGPTTPAVIFVQNTGTNALTLGTPTVQAGGQGIFVLNTTGFPGSLAIGASATFSIAFDPGVAGQASCVVEFTHNDATTANPYVLHVTGNGIAPEVTVHESSVVGPIVTSGAAANLGGGRDCGSINVSAGATTPVTIVLENTGTLDLTVGTPTMGGANASDFSISTMGMASTLPPGGSTSFFVSFDPSLGGIKTADVTFTHNDPVNPSPFLIPVIGTAVDPTGLQIITTDLPYGVSGAAYQTTQLQAQNGNGTYTWSVFSGNLPPGLNLDSGGLVSGTPYSIATVSYTFTVRVMDATGATHEQQLKVSVVGGDVTSRGRDAAGCAAEASGTGSWLAVLMLLIMAVGAWRRRKARVQ